MHAPRRYLAYIALGVSGATFAGAAAGLVSETPLVAVLLIAQSVALAALAWVIRDAWRSREEVATLRAELAAFKKEMAHLDEHTELLAARTQRLAQLLEVRTAVRPSGNDGESTGEIISFPAGPRVVR